MQRAQGKASIVSVCECPCLQVGLCICLCRPKTPTILCVAWSSCRTQQSPPVHRPPHIRHVSETIQMMGLPGSRGYDDTFFRIVLTPGLSRLSSRSPLVRGLFIQVNQLDADSFAVPWRSCALRLPRNRARLPRTGRGHYKRDNAHNKRDSRQATPSPPRMAARDILQSLRAPPQKSDLFYPSRKMPRLFLHPSNGVRP